MSKITFFEKTGCVNNTKQKQILSLSGYEVEAINLITYEWTKEELLEFFKDEPVTGWFNKNAPAITSGELDPATFTGETVIDALLSEHILIKRPLLKIGEERLIGFDIDAINTIMEQEKVSSPKLDNLLSQNLEDCPQKPKRQVVIKNMSQSNYIDG